MLDLNKCKEEFIKYTEKFDLEEVRLKRKQLHSLRVMQKSKRIAESLNLNKEEVEIATLIGLLHDIGRFEQYTKYHTFSDRNSVDHANLGVSTLKENNYIEKYITDKKWIDIILVAIKNHNKYKIEQGLGDKQEMFCKIIRDADKADIMYEGSNVFWSKKEEVNEIEGEKVRDEELVAVKNHTLVDRRKFAHETGLDNLIIMVCFTFDINYPMTFKIIDEENTINNIFKKFNFKNSETTEKMEEIHKEINNYIKENKAK